MIGSYTIILVILIFLSAYFSATETAFSSLNKTRLRALAEQGSRRAKLSLQLSENYDRLISTILIGNNIVNIAAASLGTVLFVRLCGDLGATVSTVVLTVAVLIFGEITPKSIAKDCPERFAMATAPVLAVLIRLLSPLSLLFSGWQRLISRLLQLKRDSKRSQAELMLLVDEVEQDGSIDAGTGELLRNAISFTQQTAEDVLTHRTELEALPVDAAPRELAALFARTRFSRIPIYQDSIDNILGVVHQKDLYTGDGISTQSIRALMSPVIYVFKSEAVSRLLCLLQKSKTHVAVVLDEFGGTYGIVTLEDVLEELVGEIYDEHDEIDEPLRCLSDDRWLADGSLSPQALCRALQLPPDTQMSSLNGWMMELLGHPAAVGESAVYHGMVFTVTQVQRHRVQQLSICRSAAAGEGAPGADPV